MIAPVVVDSMLESHDFDVQCVDCEVAAAVAVKGCCDDAHELLCAAHYGKWFRRWVKFLMKMRERGTVTNCEGCHRPMLTFEDHFHVDWLKG